MKRYFFLLTLCIITSQLFAQTEQNDTTVVYSSTTEAVQKIKELVELSESYRNKNPQKAAEYGLRAITLSHEISNSELLQTAEFSTGFAYYIQNEFDKAIKHWNNSLDISRLNNNVEEEAASLNRLGNVYQLKGQYEKALSYYEQAMEINKRLANNEEIARTLTNIGSIYRLFGHYEQAINQHLEALRKYEELRNNEGIAWSALNIARLFKMMQNYTKSLEYVNQSLEIYEQTEEDHELNIGVTLCLKELGSIYYEMGDMEKAVSYSQKVLQRNKASDNLLGVANSLITLGKIYFDNNQFDKSEKYLAKAKHLKDSLNDNTEIASILRYLGKIYLNRGNTKKAGEYLHNSLDFALNQNLKEEIKETYLVLSELSEKEHNPEKALTYYKKYTGLKDSLNNQKINELELQYEFDKTQRKIEFEQKQKDLEQKAKLQKERIYKWVFATGFLFMMILAYMIFKSYQRKKKTNVLLTKQRNEIAEQKDEIEAQRDFVTKQRDQIARQNTVITDSIEYARRIQTALFPQVKFLNRVLNDYFIYMKPKNIVSGDFYWVTEKENKLIVTVSDCTGHGVPGAFMSMLGIAFLNEIVNKSKKLAAGKILDELRETIIDSLHQEYGIRGSKDGMDMALCIIDKQTLEMQYAGAYNSVLVVRNHVVEELKADKMPIGIHAVNLERSFTSKQFQLQKNDVLYLFSDGYVDQFGGNKGLKFKQKPFKELLVQISELPMSDQKQKLEKTMKQWQGDYSQLDDMMVMGIRI